MHDEYRPGGNARKKMVLSFSGVVLLMAAGCPGGGSPLTLGKLTLSKNIGQPIWSQDMPAQTIWAFNTQDLSPQVTGQPLAINASFIGPAPRSETVFFVIDPNDHIQKLTAAGIVTMATDSLATWDLLTNQPASPINWPNGVALKWETGYPGWASQRQLFTSDFYGASVPQGLGAPNGPDSVAIRSAYVYDHGSCSKPLALQPILADQLRSLSSDAISQGLPAGSTAKIDWIRAANFLEQSAHNSLHGGFLVNFGGSFFIGPTLVSHPKVLLKIPIELLDFGVIAIDQSQSDTLYQDRGRSTVLCDRRRTLQGQPERVRSTVG
jgi:hypothetical protein